MKELSIFGDGTYSDSALITRQRRLNCFYDIRLDGDKHQSILRNTPGSFALLSLAAAPVRGFRVVGSLLYVVSGQNLYSINSTGIVSASLGMLASSAGLVGMTDNGFQLLIVDGVYGYCYTIVTGSYAQAALDAAGSFGQLTDANFPNGATTAAFLSLRAEVEGPDSKNYYVSAQNDVTNWTNSASLPTFGTKNDYSDNLAAVDALNGLLVLWGTRSIQFAQDSGLSPNPFTNINGATSNWGLAAKNSRAAFSGSMAFLAQPPEGGVQVCMLNGYQPMRISDNDIEDLISSFASYQDAIALTYTAHGHKFYQLTFPTADRTIVYDGTTKFWHEAQTGLGLTARHFANIGVTFNTLNYVSDASTGTVYQLQDDLFTDNGMPIKRQFVTRHIHQSGSQFSLANLFLDFDTGEGTQTGQGSDPEIMIQVSTDNGRTFGKEKWRKLGRIGQYLRRILIRRLGRARDYVIMFTVTDPVPFIAVHGAASIVDVEP